MKIKRWTNNFSRCKNWVGGWKPNPLRETTWTSKQLSCNATLELNGKKSSSKMSMQVFLTTLKIDFYLLGCTFWMHKHQIKRAFLKWSIINVLITSSIKIMASYSIHRKPWYWSWMISYSIFESHLHFTLYIRTSISRNIDLMT